ncbi:MAG: hypothetical protein OSJ74_06915 [Clostridia bacterium]|nr:hypothetical protein [Clostridia bacterium]
MKKKVLIATSASVIGIMIIVIIVLGVLFAPRDLKNLIDKDGAVSVTIIFSYDIEKEYQLDTQEEAEFWEQLNNAKYIPQRDLVKGRSDIQVSITYKDGNKIIFDEYRVAQYDFNGDVQKVTPISTSMDVFEIYKNKFALN